MSDCPLSSVTGSPLASSSPIEKRFRSYYKNFKNDTNNIKIDGFDPILIPKDKPRPWPEWSLKCFEIGKKLEPGKMGHTFLARTTHQKRIVALKIMPVKPVVDNKLQYLINRETEIHSQLRHENINRMFGYFKDKGSIVYVMAYEPGGDVYTELISKPEGRFRDQKAATYVNQVAKALIYLHSLRIIHRDIKPESLLIGYYGEIKLKDFDCAVINTIGPKDRKYRRTVCGTWDYMPPEMVAEAPYNEKVDLWSVGVLIFELLVGRTPFVVDQQENVNQRISNATFSLPSHLSSHARNIIGMLIQVDPIQRMSLQEIRKHPWILENNFEPSKKQLLPCFHKFRNLESQLISKYRRAGQDLVTSRLRFEVTGDDESYNSRILAKSQH